MRRIAASFFLIVLVSLPGLSQEAQNTNNKADQMLRSNGTVNPSTLGLEMNIPLGGYTGRGITLPLGLSYSSKVWRFEAKRVWVTPSYGGELPTHGETWTYVAAQYSENAAAGWTSSISQPYIEYTGEYTLFNGFGTPIVDYWVPPPCGSHGCPSGTFYVRRITAHLPGGASYELRDGDGRVDISGGMPSSNGTYRSVDGSGARYEENSLTGTYRLYLPDGSYYDFGDRDIRDPGAPDPEPAPDVRWGTRLTDVNGNYVQFNAPAPAQGLPNGSLTDQLGRTFPVVTPRFNLTSPVVQNFTMPGMSAPYSFTWVHLSNAFTPSKGYSTMYKGDADYSDVYYKASGNTLFADGNIGDCGGDQIEILFDGSHHSPAAFDPVVLNDITLPNGAKYSFAYNPYGEVEQIYYPSGGYEEFDHMQVAPLAQLDLGYRQSNRGVNIRRVYESGGSTPSTWTYTADSSKNRYRTTVTAPDGTRTERFMLRGMPPQQCYEHALDEFPYNWGLWWGYDNVLAGRAYDEQVFDSSGNIAKRTITKWDRAENVNVQIMPYPQRFAQLNPRTTWVQNITYDGNNAVGSATTLEYHDGYQSAGSPLNVHYKKEYAFKVINDPIPLPNQALPDSEPTFGDPTTGATLVRVTDTSYINAQAYLDRNLLSLPSLVMITDGANPPNPRAKTQTFYDEGSYLVEDDPSHLAPGWATPEASPSPYVRGLPTTTKTWYDTQNNLSVQTHVKYNEFGSARFTIDGNNNVSQISYADNYSDGIDRHTYAFPTYAISPVPGGNGSTNSLETVTSYHFATNQTFRVTDPNGLVTEMEYDDPLKRPTKVTPKYNGAAVGAETITEYGVPSGGVYPENQRFIKVRSQIDASTWKEGYTWMDGLMRTSKTQSVDDDGDVFVLTCYDNMGRVSKASNPFRNWNSQDCSTANGTNDIFWTTNTFDSAGRPWKVTTADSAVVTTTYGVATTGSEIGTVVTVADQAGKLRRSVTNALGQLKRVDEPNSSGQLDVNGVPAQPTTYTYDLLNNLTGVTQGVQTRSFVYDSLSRLKTATNPELGTTPTNGTITYSYDNNSNLISKIDPRGITTSYQYDALNRVYHRGYSGEIGYTTPAVDYYYDNVANAKGKLSKVSSSTSTTEYTMFDILGRVTGHKQTTGGQQYTTAYTYNLAGGLVDETYPSTRVVRNVLDASGDLSMVESKKNANAGFWHYADSISYAPSGAVTSLQLGNGHWESTTLNSRLQPMQIALGVLPGQTNLLKLDYSYGDWVNGNIDATKNNSNIVQQIITVPNSAGHTDAFTATQKYYYDSLNRIDDATETIGGSQTWRQDYMFDRYGNRNFVEANTTTIPRNCGGQICALDHKIYNPTINTTDNKLSSSDGYGFDSGGNTTGDPQGRTFKYDSENKQVEVRNSSNQLVGQYFYDGDGKRTEKKAYDSAGTLTEDTIFVYDATGRSIAEYSLIDPGQGDSSSAPTVSYLTADHLGSPRINTDASGAVLARHDYHPYGEEMTTTQRTAHPDYSGDAIRRKFTGYERDGEIDLDFAHARMYAKNYGRFSSTDPMGFKKDLLGNAQNLNRYLYTRNSPLTYVDRDGKCTAPSGLAKGQVGICIEAFIPTKKVPGSILGNGDNRTFERNNPNVTSRVQVQLVATASKDSVSVVYRDQVGKSEISPPVLGAVGVATGTEVKVGFAGTAHTEVNYDFSKQIGTEGFGTTNINVSLTAKNGVSSLGDALQMSPGLTTQAVGAAISAAAPSGEIGLNWNFSISGSGETAFIGGETKGYPAYAAYAYQVDENGTLTTTVLKEVPAGNLEELDQPMKKTP